MSGGGPFFWANAQPNDETISTGTGNPVQVSKVPAAAVASLGSSVATIAALQALSTNGLPQGASAYVQSVGAFWTYQPTSALTPDGITVVNASGVGQWLRGATGIAEAAQATTLWLVNSVAGNDENDGTFQPLKTFAEIARRMGTWRPTLNVQVTVRLVSFAGAPDSDPWQFVPQGTGSLVLDGTLGNTQVFTGVIGGLVARNRANGVGQLWQISQYAGAAVGQRVVNATRANSVAFVIAVGGGLATLTQPTTPTGVNPGSLPTNVDTWANGDTITAFSPPPLRVLESGFLLTSFVATLNTQLLHVHIHGAFGFEETYVRDGTSLIECTYSGGLVIDANLNFGTTLYHCSFAVAGQSFIDGGSFVARVLTLAGGACRVANLVGATIQNGFIFTQGVNFLSGGLAASNLNDVCVASGATLNVAAGPIQVQALLWGLGGLNVLSTTVRYLGTAAANLLISTLQLDNVAQAWAQSSAAGTVTWSGPRALSAANLDATVAGGGFTDSTALGTAAASALNGRSCLTTLSL